MKSPRHPKPVRTADGPRRRRAADGPADPLPGEADATSLDRALCAAWLLDGLYARVLQEAPLMEGTAEHAAVERIRRHLAGHAATLRALGAGDGREDCGQARAPGESPFPTIARIDRLLGTALSLHAFAQRFAPSAPPPGRMEAP